MSSGTPNPRVAETAGGRWRPHGVLTVLARSTLSCLWQARNREPANLSDELCSRWRSERPRSHASLVDPEPGWPQQRCSL
jgi:hypothetical protein